MSNVVDPSNNSCIASPPPPPSFSVPRAPTKYKKIMQGILSPRIDVKAEADIKKDKENWMRNNLGGGEFQKIQKI